MRFTKLGKVRFVGHRDVARIWERALRRAGLPVAITEGFSPRPKMHFGLALSTAHESFAEYLDVDLIDDPEAAFDPGTLPALLSPLLPPGIDVVVAEAVDRRATSLQQAVTSCTWVIEAPDVGFEMLEEGVERLLGAEQLRLVRTRKGKEVTDDLRPAVLSLGARRAQEGLAAPWGSSHLEVELATQPRGVRPSELLEVFEPKLEAGHICRTHQWIALDGARQEPLSVATPVLHALDEAEVRAS